MIQEQIPLKLSKFIEKNNQSSIYKASRSECWNKVTYYFMDKTRRTLNQQDIDCLINIGKAPKWI